MIVILAVLVNFAFPALAQHAWRSGGTHALWRLTALGAGGIMLLAAILASVPGGNALAATHGYGYTASRALIYLGCTLGLPLLTASMSVRSFAGRFRPGLVYAVGVISTFLSWALGVILATRILSAIA